MTVAERVSVVSVPKSSSNHQLLSALAQNLHSRKCVQRRRLRGRFSPSWTGQKGWMRITCTIRRSRRLHPLHPTLMFEDADDIVIPGFSGIELCAEDFPTKLPKPQPKRPPTPHVTVHQYNHGSQRSSRSSPLDAGRRAAEMATNASGWRTVNPPVFECMPPPSRVADLPPTLTVPTQ